MRRSWGTACSCRRDVMPASASAGKAAVNPWALAHCMTSAKVIEPAAACGGSLQLISDSRHGGRGRRAGVSLWGPHTMGVRNSRALAPSCGPRIAQPLVRRARGTQSLCRLPLWIRPIRPVPAPNCSPRPGSPRAGTKVGVRSGAVTGRGGGVGDAGARRKIYVAYDASALSDTPARSASPAPAPPPGSPRAGTKEKGGGGRRAAALLSRARCCTAYDLLWRMSCAATACKRAHAHSESTSSFDMMCVFAGSYS